MDNQDHLPPKDLSVELCTRAREVTISCTIRQTVSLTVRADLTVRLRRKMAEVDPLSDKVPRCITVSRDMDLFDFIQTADPRKVHAVKVQKGQNQVTLLESTKDCFMPLNPPAAGGSSSTTVASSSTVAVEVPAPVEEEQEDVQEDAYLDRVARFPLRGSGKIILGPFLVPVEEEGFLDASDLRIHTTAKSSGVLGASIVTTVVVTTSAKHVTNNSLLDDAFACRTLVDRVAPPAFFSDLRTMGYDQLFTKFNVVAAWQICLGSEEKDLEILRLKAQLAKKEAKAAEVAHLRDQVSFLSEEKSTLTAEVSVQKVTISQKDHDLSLVDSRVAYLESALNDANTACSEAETKIASLSFERDRLAFEDFKEKMEAQQEEQSQELYNPRRRWLLTHGLKLALLKCLKSSEYQSVLGHAIGRAIEFARRRWLLTHGLKLALLKCLKSSEYQSVLGHAIGRAIEFGMHEGLEAGHEHGTVQALEDAYFPLVDLLKSKKDAEMDKLTVPIHHPGDKTIFGETSLSFALMNVHSHAEGAKNHAAALRKLMIDIVSDPLSS
ncbi:hypothetical protein Tco_0429733 [Tanacetum coccineum]